VDGPPIWRSGKSIPLLIFPPGLILKDDGDEEELGEVEMMEAVKFLFRVGEDGWNPRRGEELG